MAHQVRWNAVYLQEFIRLGSLTEDQEAIIRARVAGWSAKRMHAQLGFEFKYIESCTDSLKKKYDNCQPFSDILPARDLSGNVWKKRG